MRQTIKLKRSVRSELERAYDKIHVWFFAYPQEEFSLNDICKQLAISKTTANKIVLHLEAEHFLEKHVLGKLWRIKANPAHPYFVRRKIPFNLKSVYESGILEWISENIPEAKAVVLFGSYRKGDDLPESDLDIAVEIAGDKELEIITATIPEFGYRKNVKVNVQVFTRNHINLNLFASIANGIVLEGFLEVRP